MSDNRRITSEGGSHRPPRELWNVDPHPTVFSSAFAPFDRMTHANHHSYRSTIERMFLKLLLQPKVKPTEKLDVVLFKQLFPLVMIRPDVGVSNDGFDNREHDYILCVNDILTSPNDDQYLVIDMLGTGTFGQVVKCQKLGTAEMFAVKVIKNEIAYAHQAQTEVFILRSIHSRNTAEDLKHIVKWFGDFTFRKHLCLVFEMLSINLFEMIKQQNYRGISLVHLRSFVKQILHTLVVLARMGIIHCDLKPENILLKNLDSTDIKIIDFGSACMESKVKYTYVQSRFYRSPEVLLSMNYNYKIDVWSLGCIAGELFLGLPLFPGSSEQNMICRIVEMIDTPTTKMLEKCAKTNTYFNLLTQDGVDRYELKSADQYAHETNEPVPTFKRYFQQRKLKDIVMNCQCPPNPPQDEMDMRECFADFLSGLLQLDPEDRWTPAEAMSHPFVLGQVLENGKPWTRPPRGDQLVQRGIASLDLGPIGSRRDRKEEKSTTKDGSGKDADRSRGADSGTRQQEQQQQQQQQQHTKPQPQQAPPNQSFSSSSSKVVMPKNMQGTEVNTRTKFKFGTYSPSPVHPKSSDEGEGGGQR